MGDAHVRLKLLLRQKHWQTYSSFCRQYDRVARSIDRNLVGSYPSRAQFHRWLSGEVKGLPYPHHCQVLEKLLPDWNVGQLFEVVTADQQNLTPKVPAQPNHRHLPSSEPESALLTQGFADVVAVFPTRSEFTSKIPPHSLFDDARELRLAGLSLNVLCQQYADDRLGALIESGAVVRCLFLDPDGAAIKAREQEEGYDEGHLTALTRLNIQILGRRVRKGLSQTAQERLLVHVYDETIRFNLTLVDSSIAVVQPYLHGIRGVEAPTFMLRNDNGTTGLFPTFEKMFNWLWDRSAPA